MTTAPIHTIQVPGGTLRFFRNPTDTAAAPWCVVKDILRAFRLSAQDINDFVAFAAGEHAAKQKVVRAPAGKVTISSHEVVTDALAIIEATGRSIDAFLDAYLVGFTEALRLSLVHLPADRHVSLAVFAMEAVGIPIASDPDAAKDQEFMALLREQAGGNA